jgi:hypothetical protein
MIPVPITDANQFGPKYRGAGSDESREDNAPARHRRRPDLL